MKNLFKKISALVLAAIMVLSMCTAVFASMGDMKGTIPSPDDKGQVTISGIESGDTVKLYKIVKANYNTYGFYGYSAVVDKTIADTTTYIPTAKEIADLANNDEITKAESASVVAKGSSVEITNLEVGSYLVKVIAGKDNITVYNPMVVTVSYVSANDTTKILYGTVSADSDYVVNGSKAYVKSSKDTIPDKKIVDTTGNVIVNGEAAGKGDAVAKGDTVNYKISGIIPSYNRDYYKTASYVISDTISEGLDFADGTQAKLQTQANTLFGEGKATVAVNGRTITITLDSDYILSLANKTADSLTNNDGRKYEFIYSAVLNGKSVNFDASTNTVHVNYTNKPDNATDSEKAETYHYTFNFNGEVQKVGPNNEVLPGAVFGLFTDEECKTAAYYANDAKKTQIKATSANGTGAINFTGLDDKAYYMKEIETPSSEYKLNDTVYKIEFAPKFNADGSMLEYKVTVKDLKTGTEISNTYVKEGLKPGENGETPVINITKIQNTKLGSLPSTGGMGTYLFTIVGVVLMTCAAGAFFVSRRKTNK